MKEIKTEPQAAGLFPLAVARGWKGIADMLGGCSISQAKSLARHKGLPVRLESHTPTLDAAEYLDWRRRLDLWTRRERRI